jgi:hypothetical protein
MMIAAMVGYYVVAIGLVALVGYLAGRKNNQEIRAFANQAIAELQAIARSTPPVEGDAPPPIPKLDIPTLELLVTLKRHPTSDAAKLPSIAARVIGEASKLEQSCGGEGLDYDPVGSIEEPSRLVLRLVPKLHDEYTEERLWTVVDELNRFVHRARDQMGQPRNADLREQIDRELQRERAEVMQDVEGISLAAARE